MTITADWLATSTSREESDVEAVVVDISGGADAGSTHETTRSPFTIGSGDAADIQLTEATVSRLHCEIEREGSLLRVRDLGSRNGTWSGNVRVIEAIIQPGTALRVGSATISIRPIVHRLPRAVWHGGERFGGLLGRSRAMQDLFALLAQIGPSHEPVLVRGETGTGKEVVARALHEARGKARAPFVVVDGGALSRNMADVELFGHARGAFTGAQTERAGAFERAHGGTLFLDEIGEVPLEVQPKLLRVIETGTVQRLGEGERRKAEVRLIAATHRPLARMVNEGTFREDLYYRLSVLEIALPPLRDRADDVELLALSFLADGSPADVGLRAKLIDAVRQSDGYRWPGNVRELRNFVRRFAAFGGAPPPSGASDDAADDLRVDLDFHEAKRRCVERFERRYLSRVLDEAGGSVTRTAERAGLNRPHLSELLGKLGLRKRRG